MNEQVTLLRPGALLLLVAFALDPLFFAAAWLSNAFGRTGSGVVGPTPALRAY